MAKRDYYDVLGISRSATADEIKKAHRKLVRQYHPDVNKNNKSAEEKFKEAQEAYDVLSDTSKRQNYDQFGHAGVGAGGGPGAAGVDPFEAFRRAQQGRGRGGNPQQQRGPGGSQVEDFDFNDFAGAAGGGGGGYGDIFEQLFGGGGAGRGKPRGGARAAAQPKGGDIDYPVTLTFEQAARGTTISLQMNRGGTVEPLDDIKIPAGVKEANRVRIKGKGQQLSGGQSGDLFLVTTILPHPFYRRDGLDVLVDAPISLYEALLGTKLTVPTLDGPLTLTIPPGTSSGAKLRIKDRGVFRGTEKGDQFVVVKIIVPKELDSDDKAAIESLAAKHPINARADLKWNV